MTQEKYNFAKQCVKYVSDYVVRVPVLSSTTSGAGLCRCQDRQGALLDLYQVGAYVDVFFNQCTGITGWRQGHRGCLISGCNRREFVHRRATTFSQQ